MDFLKKWKSHEGEKEYNISIDLNHLTLDIICGVTFGGLLKEYEMDVYEKGKRGK